MLTALALATGMLAGVAYWLTRLHPAFFVAGGLLVGVSGVLDSLDGIVARLTGRTSAAGDFLDHFFDRLVNLSIFAGLALSPRATFSLGLATAIVVLLNSYLGTQIQASFGTRHYSGLGKGQLVAALVLGSPLLALWPDAVIPIAGRELAPVDLCFVLVALSTLQAIVHRVRLGLRLASQANGQER